MTANCRPTCHGPLPRGRDSLAAAAGDGTGAGLLRHAPHVAPGGEPVLPADEVEGLLGRASGRWQ
jgi:hypothetical protein